jgi:K+/H+ antiporter YhaU regulatory subunit KhtT
MIGILTLIFVIALSMLITKVASIALIHTGMERERAKFQARSAFTGAGFTTSESEMVVKHPMRRKIIMALLLLGNAGFVTAISSLIIGFSGAQSSRGQMTHVYLLLAGLLLLFLITRSRRLERMMDKIIIRLLTRYTDLRPKNFERLMTIMDDFEVMEVSVRDNPWLCDSTLAELKLPEEGLLVLGVIQRNEKYNGVPRGGYRIRPEDRLVIYGQAEQIANLTQRRDKLEGREKHLQSKEEFLEMLHRQEEEEEAGPEKKT